MKVVYTESSFHSLEEITDMLLKHHSVKKVNSIREKTLDKVERLKLFSEQGQIEPNLISLDNKHRYILEKQTKIIYRIINDTVIVTDFFDTRQNLKK